MLPNPTGQEVPVSPPTAARGQPSRVAPLLVVDSNDDVVDDAVDVDDGVGDDHEVVVDVDDRVELLKHSGM